MDFEAAGTCAVDYPAQTEQAMLLEDGHAFCLNYIAKMGNHYQQPGLLAQW